MQSKTIEIGEFKLVSTTRTLFNSNGDEISLNWKNYSVLKLLFDNQNEIVDRKELIKEVWEDNFPVGDKALPTAIWNLRKIFEGSSINIETIPKKGYRLSLSDQLDAPLKLNEKSKLDEKLKLDQKTNKSLNAKATNEQSSQTESLQTFILLSVFLGGIIFLGWWFYSGTQSDTDTQSRVNQIALFSRSSSGADHVKDFVSELEVRIRNKSTIELLDIKSEKLLLQSDSIRQLAKELKVKALLYVEVDELSQGRLEVSVKIEQINSKGFETRSWTVNASELSDLIPQIMAMLPADDWH